MNKKLIFFLTLVVIATGSSALADTPVVYNGCMNVTTGLIRLIPSKLPAPFNNQCNTTAKDPLLKEIAISWNQAGVANGVTTAIYGTVNTANNCTVEYGSGFTCTHTSTGQYQVTFDNKFSGPPVCLVQAPIIPLLSCYASPLPDYSGITVNCLSADVGSISLGLDGLVVSGDCPWTFCLSPTDVPEIFTFICVQ